MERVKKAAAAAKRASSVAAEKVKQQAENQQCHDNMLQRQCATGVNSYNGGNSCTDDVIYAKRYLHATRWGSV